MTTPLHLARQSIPTPYPIPIVRMRVKYPFSTWDFTQRSPYLRLEGLLHSGPDELTGELRLKEPEGLPPYRWSIDRLRLKSSEARA
ncbi:hypothetical protein CEXT_657041 [Caerostris extrusa]|uniref:Uncharacterized protein n=1 Tax=Caerostris extrusa TaxID=172846 RepID=A0AAV4M870_CAEEX|nr:hypothetical protein CEXT_657041 [Caerostris extrusa]